MEAGADDNALYDFRMFFKKAGHKELLSGRSFRFLFDFKEMKTRFHNSSTDNAPDALKSHSSDPQGNGSSSTITLIWSLLASFTTASHHHQ